MQVENSVETTGFSGGPIIGICIIVVIAALFIYAIVFDKVYKGKIRRVEIEKKREVQHVNESYRSMRYIHGDQEYTLLTVDYHFEGKTFSHTKFVSRTVFDGLEEGRMFTVRIKGNRIIEVLPEEHK